MPLLKRASKRGGTRLYVVSDFHASDPAWRKLLNAIRLNAYKADAVLYAGDLTGKAMVPIVAVGGDRYEATLLGQRRVGGVEVRHDVQAGATALRPAFQQRHLFSLRGAGKGPAG